MARELATAVFSVTGNTSQFETEVKTAGSSLDKFSASATQAGNSHNKFHTHLLTSRGTLSTFASVTGTNARELHHLVHAFEAFPLAIGVTIGAILLLKEAYSSAAEAAKKAEEDNKKFTEGLRDTQLKIAELKPTKFGEVSKDIEKQMEEAKKRILESRRDFVFGMESGILEFFREHVTGDTDETKKFIEQQKQLEKQLITARKKFGPKTLESEKEKEKEKETDRTIHHHISAVQAGQLAVFKVEHGRDPNTAILQQIERNTGKRTIPARHQIGAP